ncbi:hypothetical protein FW796_17475 [Pseudomonas sp. 910_21]
MPANWPASLAPSRPTPSLASQLLRGDVYPSNRPATCRSRLAGELARKPCTVPTDAFAGKPAPTGRWASLETPRPL